MKIKIFIVLIGLIVAVPLFSSCTPPTSDGSDQNTDCDQCSSEEQEPQLNPVHQQNFVTIPGLYHYTRTLRGWLDGTALPAGTFINAADLEGIPKVHIVNDMDGKALLAKAEGVTIPLSFRDIEPGMYFIRIMGRVNKEIIPRIRRPILLDLKINDGPNGEKNHYRMRLAYDNTVKEVARIFFHALKERNNLKAELSVAKGSYEDLLIHRIEFFDALAGTHKVAAKRSFSSFTKAERDLYREEVRFIAAQPPYTWNSDKTIYYPDTKEWRWANRTYHGKANSTAERYARDRRVWDSLPPVNSMHNGGTFGIGGNYKTTFQMAPNGKSASEDQAENGKWELDSSVTNTGHFFFDAPWKLVNKKLGLEYTLEDYKKHKPLPDPYPWKDTGTGLYFENEHAPIAGSPGTYYNVIGNYIYRRIYFHAFQALRNHDGGGLDLARRYHAMGAPDDDAGNDDAARDAAILLIRMALNYPAYHLEAQDLTQVTAVPHLQIKSDYRWEGRRVGQFQYHGWAAHRMEQLAYAYDHLFDYIDGNEELAARIHDFIPWIKNSRDVIKLLDTNILQYGVTCLKTGRITASSPYIFGMIQTPTPFSNEWMNAVTSKINIYPARSQSIDYHYHNSYSQDGTSFIGSTHYVQGEIKKLIELYKSFINFIQEGGVVPYNLSDLEKYPKIRSAARFLLDIPLAGGYSFAVGDVAGAPYDARRPINSTIKQYLPIIWETTKDPRAAWLMVNESRYGGRRGMNDNDWNQIVTAAATISRDPRISSTSRVLPGFGLGILEEGVENDDYRQKTAVQLRVGTGQGHAHTDALDLNFFALGLRMGTDVGQRDEGSNFTLPPATRSIVHNLVEVDGLLHPWKNRTDPNDSEAKWPTGNFDLSDAWIDIFKPMAGGQIIGGEGITGNSYKNLNLYRRDLALIDIDGESAYVMDLFRVSGGKIHTWSFHGAITNAEPDGFTVNADLSPLADRSDEIGSSAMYMRKYANGKKFDGTAPITGPVVATWRLGRSENISRECNGDNTCLDVKTIPAEQRMYGKDFDENAPRKYTKITLFEHEGERLMMGHLISGKYKMNFPRLHVQKSQPINRPYKELPNLESVYPVVLEAYAGTSKLGEKASVAIDNNEDDARKAVLIETKIGADRIDWFFSDTRDKARTINSRNAAVQAARVVYSEDGSDMRIVNMVGGRLFQKGDLSIVPNQPFYRATITNANYPAKEVTINGDFPNRVLDGELFHFYNEGHHSAYKVIQAGGNRLKLENSANVGKINITNIMTDGQLQRESKYLFGDRANRNRGFTATPENHSKSVIMERYDRIPPGSMTMSDLTDQDGDGYTSLLIYDYGVNDTVELPTHVAIKRIDTDRYQVDANIGFTITFPATGTASFTPQEGETIIPEQTIKDGKMIIAIPTTQLGSGQGELRLTK